MEPKYSMSAYTVFVAFGLAALAARGFGSAAAAAGIGVAVAGLGFEISYRMRRRADRALAHRRVLDHIVRLQLLGIAAAGVGAAAAVAVSGVAPLDHTTPLLRALTIGVVLASCAIYVSSLVDWYWILPKISGMVGLAPCVRTGGERFAGVTKIWFFHRAAATTIVTFVLAGVPGYMAGSTGGHGGASTAWVVLGTALAIGYNSVNNGLTAAFRYAFNPRFFVGDIIRVRSDVEDSDVRNAYVVDVSIQGLKYQVIPDPVDRSAMFVAKGNLMPMEQIGRTTRAREPHRPCESVEHCRAINWYCFRNPHANSSSDGDATPPAPYVDPLPSRPRA